MALFERQTARICVVYRPRRLTAVMPTHPPYTNARLALQVEPTESSTQHTAESESGKLGGFLDALQRKYNFDTTTASIAVRSSPCLALPWCLHTPCCCADSAARGAEHAELRCADARHTHKVRAAPQPGQDSGGHRGAGSRGAGGRTRHHNLRLAAAERPAAQQRLPPA